MKTWIEIMDETALQEGIQDWHELPYMFILEVCKKIHRQACEAQIVKCARHWTESGRKNSNGVILNTPLIELK